MDVSFNTESEENQVATLADDEPRIWENGAVDLTEEKEEEEEEEKTGHVETDVGEKIGIAQSEEQHLSGTALPMLADEISQSNDTSSEMSERVSHNSGSVQEETRLLHQLDLSQDIDIVLVSFSHCKLCGEVFKDPVMIQCLHTFCRGCLLSAKLEDDAKFKCPYCFCKSSLAEEDIVPNAVVANLSILQNLHGEGQRCCQICSTFQEEKVAAGQCVDCRDVLCKECCDKHTFSRLTLNHTIIPLEDSDSSAVLKQLRKYSTVTCSNHATEELRFYCMDCSVPVCRDCIILSHKGHTCNLATEISKMKEKEIRDMLSALEERFSDLQTDNRGLEYLEELKKAEEDQKIELQEETHRLMTVIEEQSKECMDKLRKRFAKKRSQYLEFLRKLNSTRKSISCNVKLVNAYLEVGRMEEILPMENLIKKKIEMIDKHTSKRKHLKHFDAASLPSFNINSEAGRSLSKLQFFYTNPAEKEEIAKAEKKKNNNVNKSNSPKTSINQLDLSKMHFKSSMPLASTSPPLVSPSSSRGSNNETQHANLSKSARKKRSRISGSVTLSLVNNINVKTINDCADPEITGITFVNKQDFAISDMANHKIKIFSRYGKFLHVISDPAPLSLTVCHEHLVWNSQVAKVMVKPLNNISGPLHTKSFSTNSTHPVSTFNDLKYVVANVGSSKISAYGLNGQHAHTIVPVGNQGQPLTSITAIATRAGDQLVLLDSKLKTIIVNDFDGVFCGSYQASSEPLAADWEPSDVCIDDRDNIFVTDRGRNKITLLSPTATFIKEWETMINGLSHVSCCGNLLVVAGTGDNVSLYEYRYTY